MQDLSRPANGAPQDLSPVSNTERIDVLDILRGFAIIGILLMNIEWFGRATSEIGTFDADLEGLDHAVGWLVRCFIEGKFYKLFALLFGMGFGIMLIRAKEVGRPFAAWFIRRMLVLLLIGLLHMVFVWGGDILHDYAFAGLLLLFLVFLSSRPSLRRFDQPEFFLRLGLVWMVFPFLIAATLGLGFGITSDNRSLQTLWAEEREIRAAIELLQNDVDADRPENNGDTLLQEEDEPVVDELPTEDLTPEAGIAEMAREQYEDERENRTSSAEENRVFLDGSYWQVTAFRASDALERVKFTPVFSLIILLPVFILGYWLVYSNVIRNHRAHATLFRSMAWIGLGLGLAVTIAGLLIMQHPSIEGITPLPGVGFVLFMAGQYLMTAGYLGFVVCLLHSTRWHRHLGRLAPLGRMALTNYIMQTVILAIVFHGYGFGLYGKISRAPQMLIVLAIIIFQIYFSRWWLKHYRFGPLEWAWRSLTYMKIQPMRATI